MRRPNFYSQVGLDRADHRRSDESWLAACLATPTTRFVTVWRSLNLIAQEQAPRAVWLAAQEAHQLISEEVTHAFLGLSGDTAYFALDLSHLEEPQAQSLVAQHGSFIDLRAVGPVIERGEGALLAYARGMMHWHHKHRFCGTCGQPTESRRGGHQRVCRDPACGHQHFPRTDPAVIMLVHDGERCVMGRQKIWPPGMHSTLAGFVEPGESLEEAVAREIEEEVGLVLDVAKISYHSSQPWPFPSSIMLGFHALTEHQPLRPNLDEIESARWFTREELRRSPEDETLKLPRRDSIARRLIEDWLTDGA